MTVVSATAARHVVWIDLAHHCFTTLSSRRHHFMLQHAGRTVAWTATKQKTVEINHERSDPKLPSRHQQTTEQQLKSVPI